MAVALLALRQRDLMTRSMKMLLWEFQLRGMRLPPLSQRAENVLCYSQFRLQLQLVQGSLQLMHVLRLLWREDQQKVNLRDPATPKCAGRHTPTTETPVGACIANNHADGPIPDRTARVAASKPGRRT